MVPARALAAADPLRPPFAPIMAYHFRTLGGTAISSDDVFFMRQEGKTSRLRGTSIFFAKQVVTKLSCGKSF
jgi:hypothetical protein